MLVSTTFLVGAAVKLAGACGVGIGASTLLKFFHEYEFKNKKKGDKNATDHSELLREKAKGLS